MQARAIACVAAGLGVLAAPIRAQRSATAREGRGPQAEAGRWREAAGDRRAQRRGGRERLDPGRDPHPDGAARGPHEGHPEGRAARLHLKRRGQELPCRGALREERIRDRDVLPAERVEGRRTQDRTSRQGPGRSESSHSVPRCALTALAGRSILGAAQSSPGPIGRASWSSPRSAGAGRHLWPDPSPVGQPAPPPARGRGARAARRRGRGRLVLLLAAVHGRGLPSGSARPVQPQAPRRRARSRLPLLSRLGRDLAVANIPPTADLHELPPAREAGQRSRSRRFATAPASGRPMRWIRVHKLPDYAYFTHRAHVAAGIGCVDLPRPHRRDGGRSRR